MATPALSVSFARADVTTFSAVSKGPPSSSQGIEPVFCQTARRSLQSSASVLQPTVDATPYSSNFVSCGNGQAAVSAIPAAAATSHFPLSVSYGSFDSNAGNRNYQTVYIHANSELPLAAANPIAGVFQPVGQQLHAEVPRRFGDQAFTAPLAGSYATFAPGCNYLKYDSMFLPRPEFPKYSGDPLEFKAFINNFETHIEPRELNQKALFCLLLQHCVDSVKKRIQHFAGKGDQCYQLAKERLRKEYALPGLFLTSVSSVLKSFLLSNLAILKN